MILIRGPKSPGMRETYTIAESRHLQTHPRTVRRLMHRKKVAMQAEHLIGPLAAGYSDIQALCLARLRFAPAGNARCTPQIREYYAGLRPPRSTKFPRNYFDAGLLLGYQTEMQSDRYKERQRQMMVNFEVNAVRALYKLPPLPE